MKTFRIYVSGNNFFDLQGTLMATNDQIIKIFNGTTLVGAFPATTIVYERVAGESPIKPVSPGRILRDREREAIVTSLERNHYNKRKSALELGMSERNLYRKIKEYKL